MKGSLDLLSYTCLPRRITTLLGLMLSCMLLPACAIKTTSTSLVPGKELSRQSLGSKTTSDKVDLSVVNPYTVGIKRVRCEVEQFSISYQGMTETRQETHPLDCSEAYFQYITQNITALGIPFLYDTFTGFYVFRDKCIKKTPLMEISSVASGEVIKEEVLDKKSAKCKETPIAGALVKVNMSSTTLDLVTDAQGNASLPPQKLAELEKWKITSPIKFIYEGYQAETVYIPKPKLEQNKMLRADLNSSAENDEASQEEPESDSMAMLAPEDSMATKSTADPIKPETPLEKNKMSRADLNSASGARKESPETDMMAKLNDEIAIKKEAAKKPEPLESELQVNRMSKEMNSIAAAKAAESMMMAKLESTAAVQKSAETAPDLIRNDLLAADNIVYARDSATEGVASPVVEEKIEPRLTIYFDVNKTVIKKEFRAKLKKLADEIRANPSLSALIEGHTDNTGSAEINLKMSIKRAEAIRSYLVKYLGVPANRIDIKGFGLTRPIASNDTESGRLANRRTEVIIISQSSAL